MRKLEYPILTYSSNHIRGNIQNERIFCRSLLSYLERGGFIGDLVVDANGKQYEIIDVIRKGTVFAPMYHLFNTDKYLKIEFVLKENPIIEFETLKTKLMHMIISNRGWRSYGESKSEIEARFKQIKSFGDLTSHGFASGE